MFWFFKCLPLITASLKSVGKSSWFCTKVACNVMSTCKHRYCSITFKKFNLMLEKNKTKQRHSPRKGNKNVISWATSIHAPGSYRINYQFFSRSYFTFKMTHKHGLGLFFVFKLCLSGITEPFHAQDDEEESLQSPDCQVRKWWQFKPWALCKMNTLHF